VVQLVVDLSCICCTAGSTVDPQQLEPVEFEKVLSHWMRCVAFCAVRCLASPRDSARLRIHTGCVSAYVALHCGTASGV